MFLEHICVGWEAPEFCYCFYHCGVDAFSCAAHFYLKGCSVLTIQVHAVIPTSDQCI